MDKTNGAQGVAGRVAGFVLAVVAGLEVVDAGLVVVVAGLVAVVEGARVAATWATFFPLKVKVPV